MKKFLYTVLLVFVGLMAIPESAQARWYRADLGAFMRRDPIGYVDGPSLYGYSRQNPLRYIDPHGLKCAREDRMSENKKCCEKFIIDHDIGPSNFWAGQTVCCNGRPIVCNFIDLHPEWFGPNNEERPNDPNAIYSDRGMRIISLCVTRHENIHVLNSVCKGDRDYPAQEDGHIPMYEQCEECITYAFELACLVSHISDCGKDPVCRRDVLKRINYIRKELFSSCADCLIDVLIDRYINKLYGY